MQIGLREANQRFSKTMKAVKAGKEVVLTERGKPVAVIKPIKSLESAEAAVGRMEAAGLLRAPSRRGRLPDFIPRPLKGRPLTETLREERDSD
jgi:prevent-host-death family protein